MVGFALTEKETKYLMLIYRWRIESSSEVRTTDIARFFKVRPATVTEVLRNLTRKKLLVHRPYRDVDLTAKGIKEARKLLRKHRILEVFFSDFLKYDVRRSCFEASKIDYHASTSLINDICRFYGHPRTCPCKKDIFADPSCSNEDVEEE
ncbi:MAG: metal-dependent transcriptional regulator [Hadesarchaea archaeon]|nr:metal-dependent transcriptional regulator [Hadesarchaea archaeon]